MMQPHEQLTLGVFLSRALPKIVAEHFAHYTATATHDMTLEESQARSTKHIDAMVDKSQELLKLMGGITVPEAIATLALAAYEIALFGVSKGMMHEQALNTMHQLDDLQRKQ